MGYVSENFRTPNSTIEVVANGSKVSLNRWEGVSKSQYGWRSTPKIPAAEKQRNKGLEGGSWASSVRSISNGGGYEYIPKRARTLNVNDRDFEQSKRSFGWFSYDFYRSRRLTSSTDPLPTYGPFHKIGTVTKGALALSWGSYTQPSLPSLAAAETIAAEMMRRSAPTTPEVDITRSLGELVEWRNFLKASNYKPQKYQDVGSGYLNVVFGLIPTFTDLQRILETVLNMDSILGEFVAHERQQVRRRRRHTLSESTVSGVAGTRAGGIGSSNSIPPLTGVGDYLLSSSLAATDGWEATLNWSIASHSWIESFASFEYFIPKPWGFENRMKRYRNLAAKAFGGGLTASVMYDLTPFSWLVDWFVDIGGLLRYQQQVADNGLIATRTGFSMTSMSAATVTLGQMRPIPTATSPAPYQYAMRDSVILKPATLRYEIHRRRGGSPYSMSPTWTKLSVQQWAILGALGLAYGPDAPRFR